MCFMVKLILLSASPRVKCLLENEADNLEQMKIALFRRKRRSMRRRRRRRRHRQWRRRKFFAGGKKMSAPKNGAKFKIASTETNLKKHFFRIFSAAPKKFTVNWET